ncbi:MAG: hypothetical protein HFF18_06325 [Oscillospiraceae bacterium]|nr:hypothetical protein [Oscillospiraceae bacterium]
MKKLILPLFALLFVTTACRGPANVQGSSTTAPVGTVDSTPIPTVSSEVQDDSACPGEGYFDPIPIPYTPLDEIMASRDLSELYPQFDISEITIDSQNYFKFSLEDSGVYVLVDSGQTCLTVYSGEKSTSFPINNIFPTAVNPPATLVAEDLTGDQTPELIYILSDGGMGTAYSECHIVDLSTMMEYPLDSSYKRVVGSNVKIVPQEIVNDEMLQYDIEAEVLLCEITLDGQQPLYGTIPVEAAEELDHYELIPAEDSSYFRISWEPDSKSLEVDVGLSFTDAVLGYYVCFIQGKLVFDSQSQNFVGEPCYHVTVDSPLG